MRKTKVCIKNRIPKYAIQYFFRNVTGLLVLVNDKVFVTSVGEHAHRSFVQIPSNIRHLLIQKVAEVSLVMRVTVKLQLPICWFNIPNVVNLPNFDPGSQDTRESIIHAVIKRKQISAHKRTFLIVTEMV